jgi:hypothetical protein
MGATVRRSLHALVPCRTVLLTRYFRDSARLLENAMQRRRGKQTTSLEQRLAQEAQRLREQATNLPAGKDREALLRKGRQAEAAAHVKEWITSPGLRPPT